MVEEQLQQAYQFIKAGEKARAEALLRPLVAEDADNADAWWLLANAIDDSDDIREALGHVLRLRPDHAKGQLMLKRTNARYPSDGTESIEELLAAEYDGQVPRQVVVTKPKRQNNILIIVLIVGGVLSMVGCAACAVMAGGVVMLEEVMNDPELAGLMDILVEGIEAELISKTTVDQGTIERGQTVRDDLGPYIEHTWTFRGTLGEEVTLDLQALSSDLDPVLHLYGPDGEQVAENDDREGSLDSLIVVDLPVEGSYTVVVSGYNDTAGRYELKLEIGGPLV